MTFMLRCPQCDSPVEIINDNGVTDPAKTRWEEYECAYGHVFSRTLEPRR